MITRHQTHYVSIRSRHTHTHTQSHKHTHTHTHRPTNTHTHTHTHILTHRHTHTYVQNIHPFTHIHTHTHIHTQTRAESKTKRFFDSNTDVPPLNRLYLTLPTSQRNFLKKILRSCFLLDIINQRLLTKGKRIFRGS